MDEAGVSLDLHDGSPNPSTLAFITKRLYDKRDAEAKIFQDLQCEGAITSKNVSHLIFALAGNDPSKHLATGLKSKHSGIKRKRVPRSLLVPTTALLSQQSTKLMAQNPEAISQALAALIQPDARGRLLARGLARGMVWREGVVPEGAQNFSVSLTPDLLDFGYGILSLALELRDANRERRRTTLQYR